METKTEGFSCVRCKAYLFNEDDVVYCPTCGAPHHRDCYNALRHYAIEELHSTELEYSKEKVKEAQIKAEEATKENKSKERTEAATVCNVCGESYSPVHQRCPKCGAPNFSAMGGFGTFDFLGGVPAQFEIGENVTADDARKFVLSNTHRYIPKFAVMSKKRKASWNWMAFLFPCQWLFSRKMYKGGIIAGTLTIIATLLSFPVNDLINSVLSAEDRTNFITIYNAIMNGSIEISTNIMVFAIISALISILVSVFVGVFGDYNYKKYTISSIQKIKKSEDIAFGYRKYGGVNIFAFLIATLALHNIPLILYMFI